MDQKQISSIQLFSADNFIIIFLLVVAIYCSHVFFNMRIEDQFEYSEKSDQIGHIMNKKNTAKKKGGVGISWVEIEKNDQIFADDKIYTYFDSEILLKFNNGEEVLIGENTLFVVEKEEDTTGLNILKGKASIKFAEKDSKLVLKVKNKLVELEKADGEQYQVITTEEPTIDIEKKVVEKQDPVEMVGEALPPGLDIVGIGVLKSVETVATGVGYVAKGVVVGVETVVSGVATGAKFVTGNVVKLITFGQVDLFSDNDSELLEPENGEVFDYKKGKKYLFKWELEGKKEEKKDLYLEIGLTKEFTYIRKVRQITDQTSESLTLPAGYYYWRIRGKKLMDGKFEHFTTVINEFSVNKKITNKKLPLPQKSKP
ncbi:MAG: hypothetical protein HOE90_00795 [Bacteriovoracaceae bacterium]|jgi:hypothetical protein|nr:hypothetical protein [Bacteriovoracaceae bacterium]